jgi:hypothetical protein
MWPMHPAVADAIVATDTPDGGVGCIRRGG